MRQDLNQLDADPIFVGGHARSGTTWLYDLLTGHELVAGAFETWLFSSLHGIGGVFAREQWDADLIARHTEALGRAYGLHQLVTRHEVVADVRDLLERWLSRVVEPQHRYLVEKTPTHLLGMRTITEVFPNARFIHIIRDGRDVAVSMSATIRGWNPELGEGADRLLRKAARNWRRTVAEIGGLGEEMGGRYLEIRYEDLQRLPEKTLSQTLDFCGIPYDAATVTRLLEMNRFSRRAQEGSKGFRRKGEVGDWRSHLGLAKAYAFNRSAGSMLIEKGYETNPRWWLRVRRARSTVGYVGEQ